MDMISHDRSRWSWLRWAGWGGAVALILAPLVAMQVAPGSGVDWTASDFLFATVLLGAVGLLLELAMRGTGNWPYRLGALVAVGTGFLLIWADLAVGYIGDGNSPINSAFLAIPLLALIASLLARGRPSVMTWIMGATAVAHAVTGAVGYPQDPVTGPITAVFVALWTASALLFRTAAVSAP